MSGQVIANSADAAANDLFGKNITPIEIKEITASATGKDTAGRSGDKSGDKSDDKSSDITLGRLNAVLGGSTVELGELIIFARQMYSLTKAGIPLDRAIRGLEASISNRVLKKVLCDVFTSLEGGLALAAAFGRHPKIFPPLFLSLVNVGENTGHLDLSFQQVGKYLELEQETKKQIKSATRYPIFVLSAMAVALAVITVFVIPVFAETFRKLGAELPWQTLALIAVSDFVINYWPLMLGSVAGFILFTRSYRNSDAGRAKIDRLKLSIPIIGSIFERVALARFSRTFAMMMQSGVPVVQSLTVIAQAVGNEHIGSNIIKMREGISRGESLYNTAVASKMFSPLVLQMIAVGEETGTVDELLAEVADFYDAEVEYDLKRLSDSIEPILIIFIAGLVLVLALGVFLPIWDLSSVVK